MADVRDAVSKSDISRMKKLTIELQEVSDPDAPATLSMVEGMLSRLAGDSKKALDHYHRGLELAKARGKHKVVASFYDRIGSLFMSLGEYDEALENLNAALAILERSDDREGLAVTISNIGTMYVNSADYGKALEWLGRARQLHEENGSTVHLAKVTGNIGIAYQQTGQLPTALEYYHRALDLHKQAGNMTAYNHVLGNMGHVYRLVGNYERALELFQQTIDAARSTGELQVEAYMMRNVGLVYEAQKKFDEAYVLFEKALKIFQGMGDRAGIAQILVSLTGNALTNDNVEKASEHLGQLSELNPVNPAHQTLLREGLGEIAESRGELDEAQKAYSAALEIATSAGLRSQVIDQHLHLRELALKQNDLPSYVEHNNAYMRLTEEMRGAESLQRLNVLDVERKMQEEYAKREKERALLYSALPKEVADRMIRGEDVSGDKHEHASVLFLDIVGFTTHSSPLDPHVTTQLLAQIFQRFDDICAQYNVTKVKTIGDSYMAVAFSETGDQIPETGDQGPFGGHAERIARCALDMMHAAFSWPDGSTVEFRVGLHAGPVVAGVIGTQRLQYDVWGDTVNVASRMESNSEPGRIQVSEVFAEKLQGALVVAERGTIEVKGKGWMKTYWLEGA